jgi:hypothetical protein
MVGFLVLGRRSNKSGLQNRTEGIEKEMQPRCHEYLERLLIPSEPDQWVMQYTKISSTPAPYPDRSRLATASGNVSPE